MEYGLLQLYPGSLLFRKVFEPSIHDILTSYTMYLIGLAIQVAMDQETVVPGL